MRHIGAAFVLAVCLGALAGCGGGGGSLAAPARDALHADIEAVRAAVEEERDPAALAAVADLRATVRDLTASGDLNAADAKVLLTQVDRIEAKLSSTSVVPSPTPVPANNEPKPKAEPKAKEKGKGPKK